MVKKRDEITLHSQQETTSSPEKKAGKKGSAKEKNTTSTSLNNEESVNTEELEMVYVEEDEKDASLPDELENDKLSEILNVMEQGEPIDDAIGIAKEASEPENLRKFFRYPEDTSGRISASESTAVDEDIAEVMEEVEEKPKSRWLITTCRYCGDMYRFRSNQSQPPTCGRPRCVKKFEEISKKKMSSNMKVG